jgi:hypothetical protein
MALAEAPLEEQVGNVREAWATFGLGLTGRHQ